MSKARKDPERWWHSQGDKEHSSCISPGHGLVSQAENHLEGLDMSCTALAQNKFMQFARDVDLSGPTGSSTIWRNGGQ